MESRGAKVTNFKILLFSHGVAKNAAYRLACPMPGDPEKNVQKINVVQKRHGYKLYFSLSLVKCTQGAIQMLYHS